MNSAALVFWALFIAASSLPNRILFQSSKMMFPSFKSAPKWQRRSFWETIKKSAGFASSTQSDDQNERKSWLKKVQPMSISSHNNILKANKRALMFSRKVTEIPISPVSSWTIELDEPLAWDKAVESAQFLHIAEQNGNEIKNRHFWIPDTCNVIQIRFHDGSGGSAKSMDEHDGEGILWITLDSRIEMFWLRSDRPIKKLTPNDSDK